jgi:YVTN family beta-propeller protein
MRWASSTPTAGRSWVRSRCGRPPGRLAAGFGSVWVTDFNAHTVSRIEGRDIREVIPVGGGPSAITVGNGAVWVAHALDGTVAGVDPGTERVVQTIPVGDGPSGIAYGEGLVWVANGGDHTVVGIDARTGDVTERVGLDASPTDVAVGSGAVWVTSQSAGVVFRISRDVRDVIRIRVGTGPSAIAADAGAVWVANTLDGTVSRIDPAREVVTATLQVGDGPSAVVVSPKAVWVTNEIAGTVTRIDPRTPVVAQTIAVGNDPTGIALTGGAVWVGVHAATAAHRGGTLRIVAAIPRLDSIDPGIAFLLFPPQLLGMTNDGLVTLKHVGGSDGTQLAAPDLAVSLPAAADSGRSYRFQLRPGIRYSTGEPVRPTDFRRAIERDFRIGSPGAPFFADIVRADRCAGKGKPCDLSTAILVDDQADTVTFHLTRPDPEFLFKLTLTFAFAVPPGTPDHDVGTHPVPATGPYLIGRYQPGRELRLVRNPQFHEWSPAAQPDGYPDQIVWRFGLDPQAAVTAVERGSADWGLYEFPFSPPGDRLTEIRTQYPGQTHVNPLPETEFFTLHTRVPPFNDVRVRRALNYAIDRNALASLYGGRSGPPHLPGAATGTARPPAVLPIHAEPKNRRRIHRSPPGPGPTARRGIANRRNASPRPHRPGLPAGPIPRLRAQLARLPRLAADRHRRPPQHPHQQLPLPGTGQPRRLGRRLPGTIRVPQRVPVLRRLPTGLRRQQQRRPILRPAHRSRHPTSPASTSHRPDSRQQPMGYRGPADHRPGPLATHRQPERRGLPVHTNRRLPVPSAVGNPPRPTLGPALALRPEKSRRGGFGVCLGREHKRLLS